MPICQTSSCLFLVISLWNVFYPITAPNRTLFSPIETTMITDGIELIQITFMKKHSNGEHIRAHPLECLPINIKLI